MSRISKHMEDLVLSEDELRSIIPPHPKMLDKRILSELDHYCLEIIEHAQLVIFGTSGTQPDIDVLKQSEFEVVDTKTIKLNRFLYEALSNKERPFASLYFLVPGIGHGLRINGSIRARETSVELKVEGAYVHCARAAARSALWETQTRRELGDIVSNQTVADFLAQSSFLLLKTMDKWKRTEISPRGDEAGFVKMIDNKTLFVPERPGNKVAVSMRNILQNQLIELLLMIPGSNIIMTVSGTAKLSTNAIYLDASKVSNKRPKIGIVVEACQFKIQLREKLSEAWKAEQYRDPKKLSKFSKVLSTHMNGEGLLGKATTPVVQAIVTHDMKHLY